MTREGGGGGGGGGGEGAFHLLSRNLCSVIGLNTNKNTLEQVNGTLFGIYKMYL